jgi:uncharacterized membrane protein HdeD (DUF308 family)
MLDIERSGNLIEAGFWLIFGVVVCVAGVKRGRSFGTFGVIAGLVAILFGLSDLIEARTGAWWCPWWLLAWKAVCVAVLVLSFLRYRRLQFEAQRRSSGSTKSSSSA